jgi:H+/Na+-translocating ferredoxin:NAD+ oxidoreductase subunit G
MASLKMIAALVLISLVSGISLGGLNALTHEKGEQNILKYRKVPAVISISEGVLGALDEAKRAEVITELLGNYKKLDIGEDSELLLFVSKKDGKPYTVVMEREGEGGYGGPVGVMVGFNIETGNIDGIGITTHSETPGLGAKIDEGDFQHQFIGMSKDAVFKIGKDGGVVEQVSGATKSSRAVADAIQRAKATYDEHQQKILDAIK